MTTKEKAKYYKYIGEIWRVERERHDSTNSSGLKVFSQIESESCNNAY